MSGILFACCYDDLVEQLERTGIGVMFQCSKKCILLCVIVYADDILLMASSPRGLEVLIKATFSSALNFRDISFNTDKSWILRLGKHNRPPVSVCGIPTTERHFYLGVEIGRKADPQSHATSKMYCNSNKLFLQNPLLKRCSNTVKNVCIYSYGNVYCLENELSVSSKLRQSHRYMTKAVHCGWVDYADLDGPNIRSRRLYSVFELDSLEVIHRKRRNVFLIKAETHENTIISNIIGHEPKISV